MDLNKNTMSKTIKIALALFIIVGLLFPLTQQSQEPLEGSVLIRYDLSGGIAGINDKLSILDNGEGLLVSDTSLNKGSLEEEDLDILKRALEQGDYKIEKRSLLKRIIEEIKGPPCCDLLFSSFVIQEGNRSVEIEPVNEITAIVDALYSELKQ